MPNPKDSPEQNQKDLASRINELVNAGLDDLQRGIEESKKRSQEYLSKALEYIDSSKQQKEPDMPLRNEKRVNLPKSLYYLLPIATAIAAYNRPNLAKALVDVSEQHQKKLDDEYKQQLMQWESQRQRAARESEDNLRTADIYLRLSQAQEKTPQELDVLRVLGGFYGGERQGREVDPMDMLKYNLAMKAISSRDPGERAYAMSMYNALFRQNAQSGNFGDYFNLIMQRQQALKGYEDLKSKMTLGQNILSPEEVQQMSSFKNMINTIDFLLGLYGGGPGLHALPQLPSAPSGVERANQATSSYGLVPSHRSESSDSEWLSVPQDIRENRRKFAEAVKLINPSGVKQ